MKWWNLLVTSSEIWNVRASTISIKELEDVIFFLRINKSAGYDETSLDIIKNCVVELCEPLKYIFNLSFQKGIFPDYMKIAKVALVF